MKILASSILTFFLTFPLSTLISAESTDLEEDSSTVEEVVVTGIKKSLQNAIDIKRSYVG